MKKTVIASSIALILGMPAANAALVENILGANTWSTDSANLTVLNPAGGTVGGGANDVVMNWDGNGYNASSDYTGPGGASNMAVSSATPYFSANWTAHDVQVFSPGTYSFDTTLGGGVLETGTMNVTVPTGDIGMHMLFDWNGNLNIDVFVVMAPSTVFGAGIGRSQGGTTSSGAFLCDFGSATTGSGAVGISNCLYDGPGFGSDGTPAGNKVWMLASVDGDGDGITGIPMAPSGPTAGFSANFSTDLTATPKTSTVPVPAAVWLFGSGLLGLLGVVRRKKDT